MEDTKADIRLEAAIELLQMNTATLWALLDVLYHNRVVEKEAVQKATAYKALDLADAFERLLAEKSRSFAKQEVDETAAHE